MRKSVGTGILLLALAGAAAAHAQEPRRLAYTYSSRDASRVEQILRQRTELKLSDAQVNHLEALRKEDVTRRQNYMRDLIDLESRAAAGQVTAEEMRRQSRDFSDNAEDGAARLRDQVERVLTADQRTQLQDLRAQRWRGAIETAPRARSYIPRRDWESLPLERARVLPRPAPAPRRDWESLPLERARVLPRPAPAPRVIVPRPPRPPRPPVPPEGYYRRLPETYRIPREHMRPEMRDELRRRVEELRIRREGII
jgi:Spy/CpxP family protein refolding chaperone